MSLLNQLKSLIRNEDNEEYINRFEHKSTNIFELSHTRLVVLTVLFAIAFSILAVRLSAIVILGDVSSAHFVKRPGTFHRKEIVDRNGVLLAVNLATASLYANPRVMIDKDESISKLVKLFPELNSKTLSRLFSSKKSFIWIKRNLTPNEQYAANKLGIPGIYFKREERRIYPHGNLLSHVLGFVDIDGKGLSGIEKYFDKKLRYVGAGGKHEQLSLSIDVRVQNIVHQELTNSVEEFEALGGVAIVLNTNTGEVISSVSLPDFDPHNPGNTPAVNMFNKASLGVYEIGSVFKAYTIAMALDSNSVKLNDVYYVKSPIKISKYHITDYYRSKGNWLSVPKIFMYSSNVGSGRISLDLGKEEQKKYLKLFGMLDPLEIELHEKGTPIHPPLHRWGDINTVTISYGHGIAVTPMHVASATSTIVNGGRLYKLTFLKQNPKDTLTATQVISEQTSDKMRRLLRLAVESGTGRRADVDGYLVGGKTGSADKAQKGGYSKSRKLSSFIGAFPMHDPKYVLFVMLDDPQPNSKTRRTTGATTAAPVVHKIISRIGPLLGILPVNEYNENIRKKLYIPYENNTEHLESF
jgi:cell division protein FtsI (penicillin-binding protein 3)